MLTGDPFGIIGLSPTIGPIKASHGRAQQGQRRSAQPACGMRLIV